MISLNIQYIIQMLLVKSKSQKNGMKTHGYMPRISYIPIMIALERHVLTEHIILATKRQQLPQNDSVLC